MKTLLEIIQSLLSLALMLIGIVLGVFLIWAALIIIGLSLAILLGIHSI